MEIPSSHAGVIKELKIKLGDKVSKGTLLAIVTTTGQQPAPASQQPAPAVAGAPAAPPVTAAVEPKSAEAPPTRSHAFATEMGARPEPLDLGPAPGAKPHASPSVRKFARELGVDLTAVRGSAPKGRITEDDVRSHVKGVMAGGAQAGSGCRRAQRPALPRIFLRGRRSTLPNSARSSASRCRASAGFPARADAQLGVDSARHQSR